VTEWEGGIAEEDVARPMETPTTEQARTTAMIHRLLRYEKTCRLLGWRGPEPPPAGGSAVVGTGQPGGPSRGIVGWSALMMALLSFR
jgi:hypothetical protein